VRQCRCTLRDWTLRRIQAPPSSLLELFQSTSILVRKDRIGLVCWRRRMHGIIYLVGLIVVIMAILSFFGLR
jgi:hypothetical protein